MSYVIAAPEMMMAAATDLAGIGSALSEAHAAAAAPTVALVPAAADEVSAAVTHLFSQHAAGYQALAGQAAAFQEQFVQNLHAAAISYTQIEGIIALLLQRATADLNGFVSNLPHIIHNIGTNFLGFILDDPVLFIATLLELPIFIPLVVLTSPIWIPLALIAFAVGGL